MIERHCKIRKYFTRLPNMSTLELLFLNVILVHFKTEIRACQLSFANCHSLLQCNVFFDIIMLIIIVSNEHLFNKTLGLPNMRITIHNTRHYILDPGPTARLHFNEIRNCTTLYFKRSCVHSTNKRLCV